MIAVNLEHREEEALRAEKIIAGETQSFINWLGEQAVVPAIVALKNKGRELAEYELNKAFRKLPNLTREQKKIIQGLADSIVNKLLHPAIMGLKQSTSRPQSHIYGEVIQRLFDLQLCDADNSPPISKRSHRYQIQ
jgi:glutamyl-tRNA reductase